MPSGHDAVEKLASLAELHNDVDRALVLERVFERHDVVVVAKVLHDLDLSPHVVDVDLCPQLLLRYRLTSVLIVRGQVRAEVRDPKLASTELPAQIIVRQDVPSRRLFQDPELRFPVAQPIVTRKWIRLLLLFLVIL